MNNSNDTKPLKILNASAGSGKTYHLVMAFIELLIGDDVSPTNFKHLIAMTFTNKAALEMKERIIEALDGIGQETPSKDTLKVALAINLGLAEPEVVTRCQKVLEAILHQYEDFHVMTIDKFNLRLIKSFSRDLDLPAEFEVVLDETELIEMVVDDLLHQLGDPEKSGLNNLMIQYAKSNIDEEKTWNFRRSLVEFGSILKNEKHIPGIAKLLEMNLDVSVYREQLSVLKSIDKQFLAYLQPIADAAAELDPKQVHGGGHTINDLAGILQQTSFPVQEALIKKRLATNLEKNDGKKDLPDAIRTPLLELNAFWQGQLQHYAAGELFLKNFFNMALLQYMAQALKSTKKEAQMIRISEFNSLISELIQNENAPFIYERLGTRYHHFLLDEFQDTSHLQWLNLIPLIHESISQRHSDLIVGDPKQSIYRFKNGLAEQFVALPAIYNPQNDAKIAATSSYFQQMGTIETLENNWRSSPTIVQFNNHFFETLRTHLPEETATFYNAIAQQPKSTKNGVVFIESEEGKDDEEAIVAQIITWIETCLADGFNASDICILGRRNKECNAWAIALDQAGYNVVSTDSLLIDSSAEVRLTISYLKWRLKPTGENEKKQFAELYLRHHHKSYDVYQNYLREEESASGKRYRYFDDRAFVRDHFGAVERFFFKYEHLYDLIEGFYGIAQLNELGNPYLHHLADLAHEFGLKRGPNLKIFLEEYDRKKGSIAVQIPAAKNAVNIMTIHKSKGLEFPVVLLPSLNIKLDLKSSFLIDWNDFLLYKQPSKSDVLEPLIELYHHEKNQILTDVVNLTYVAMTRPVERLYIRNHFDKSTFGALFHNVLEETGLATESDGVLQLTLSDGLRTAPETKEHPKTFSPEDISDRLWFPHIAFQDTEKLFDQAFLSDEMQFGIEFHLLMSRINSKAAIEEVLQNGIDSGQISTKNSKELSKRLHDLFDLPAYQQLFEGVESVLSEQEILMDATTTVRLDKLLLKANETILIDYKTGLPSPKDTKQVLHYSKILHQMGYPNVRCYLLYSSINELVAVS